MHQLVCMDLPEPELDQVDSEKRKPNLHKTLSDIQKSLTSLHEGQIKLQQGQTKLQQGQRKLQQGQNDIFKFQDKLERRQGWLWQSHLRPLVKDEFGNAFYDNDQQVEIVIISLISNDNKDNKQLRLSSPKDLKISSPCFTELQ